MNIETLFNTEEMATFEEIIELVFNVFISSKLGKFTSILFSGIKNIPETPMFLKVLGF